MYPNENTLLSNLFNYNLERTAVKFGLIKTPASKISDEDATQLLNIAEFYSIQPADEAKIKSFLICALLWENQESHWDGLKPFMTRVLIRMGLTSSAKMISWNEESGLFNSFGSYLEQLYATIKLCSHEVRCGSSILTLSSFQKRMWDAIDQYERVGVSAPTSAGKSFILVNKAIDTLLREDGVIVFIVPTISLINQVSNDLRAKIKELKAWDISVYQTVNNLSLFQSEKTIYVLTQERALNALNNQEKVFDHVKMLIIDEVQNIEKISSEDEERAKTLFDVIQEFKNDKVVEKIVLSGPRLKNIASFTKEWFGDAGQSVSEDIPSVLNISFSIKKIKYNRENELLLTQHLPLGYTNSIKILDYFQLKAKILGKKEYGDDAHDFIYQLVSSDREAGNIVFAGRTKQANETALALAARLTPDEKDHTSLEQFIADTVHPLYSLIPAIKKGVAFHHSKVPQHLRNLVEKAFSRRQLHTVVSTTTLMQGINLPAKNIIIRNPSLAKSDTLTGYEFTNLKGRAGRLMKDLVGRAIIIDEQECNDADIGITAAEEKNLKLGYSERFQLNRDNIQETLLQGTEIKSSDILNGDIIVYVRNMALKYGNDGLRRIHEVGVKITTEVYQQLLGTVSNLSIPQAICFGNFYWDPLTLNGIYLSMQKGGWPEIPATIYGSANQLAELITYVHQWAPFSVEKYLKINPSDDYGARKIISLCIFAQSWGAGLPLKEVINPDSWPVRDSSDIDDRVNDVHTKVMFGIPKLLRPVFQIHDHLNDTKTASVLGFIESGSTDTSVRTLIELGIPRETAIALTKQENAISFLNNEGTVIPQALARFIDASRNNPALNEWHKFLIEEI
jgi:hypothetical protein